MKKRYNADYSVMHYVRPNSDLAKMGTRADTQEKILETKKKAIKRIIDKMSWDELYELGFRIEEQSKSTDTNSTILDLILYVEVELPDKTMQVNV